MLDKQAIIKDYQNGASLVALAYKYHASHEIIKNLLKQSKVKIRKHGQTSLYAARTKGRRITKEETAQIIEMLNNGSSITKIAATLQRGRSVVLEKIREYQEQQQPVRVANGVATHNGEIDMSNSYEIRKVTRDDFHQIKNLIRDGYKSQDIFAKFEFVTKGILWSIRHASTYEDFSRRHPKISYPINQAKEKPRMATANNPYEVYKPIDRATFLKIKDAVARRVNYNEIMQKFEVSKRAITVTRHAKDFEDARRMSPKLFKRGDDVIIPPPIQAPAETVSRVGKAASTHSPYISSQKLRNDKFANAVWFLRKLAIQEGRHDELNNLTFFDIIDTLVDQWADDIASKYGVDHFETPEKELVKKYQSIVMSMRRRGYLDAAAHNGGGGTEPPPKATGEVKPYMTIEESAEYLGIWPSFVQSLVDENQINFAKNPQTGEVKIAKRDLDAYAHGDEDGI